MKQWVEEKIALSGLDDATSAIVLEYFFKKIKRQKSDLTIIAYLRVILGFLTSTKKLLPEIGTEDVYEWLESNFAMRSKSTYKWYLVVLKCFFSHCESEGYIEDIPIKDYWFPKTRRVMPKALNEKDLAILLNTADSVSLRNRLIVYFLFSTGLRRSELSKIDIENIDMTKRDIVVKQKGGHVNTVFFNDKSKFLLEHYLDRNNGPLFINRWGQRLSDKSIYDVIVNLSKKAGIKATPHILRHTLATVLLEKSDDINYVADILHHKNINVTQIYAQMPLKQTKRLYQKFIG